MTSNLFESDNHPARHAPVSRRTLVTGAAWAVPAVVVAASSPAFAQSGDLKAAISIPYPVRAVNSPMTVTVKVTEKDSGAAAAGKPVSLSSSDAGATFDPSSGTTDGSGVFTSTVTIGASTAQDTLVFTSTVPAAPAASTTVTVNRITDTLSSNISRPTSLELTSDGAKLIVTTAWGTRIVTLDTASKTSTSIDSISLATTALSPNGQFVFGAQRSDEAIRVVETTQMRQVAARNAGRNITCVAVAKNGTDVYVGTEASYIGRYSFNGSNSIASVQNTDLGGFYRRVSAMRLGSNDTKLYCAMPDQSAGFGVVDLLTGTTTLPVNIGDTGAAGVALSPDEKTLLLMNPTAGYIAVVDPTSHSLLGKVSIGAPKSAAFTPDGRTAYVTDPTNSKIYVLDVASRTITHTIDTYGNTQPDAIRISPDGKTVYVAAFNINSVYFIAAYR